MDILESRHWNAQNDGRSQGLLEPWLYSISKGKGGLNDHRNPFTNHLSEMPSYLDAESRHPDQMPNLPAQAATRKGMEAQVHIER